MAFPKRREQFFRSEFRLPRTSLKQSREIFSSPFHGDQAGYAARIDAETLSGVPDPIFAAATTQRVQVFEGVPRG